ncbi:Protein of unknown function [Gryllus bimaculatus]|nr:Protein of unknown function [Gryllus bimaculatus]
MPGGDGRQRRGAGAMAKEVLSMRAVLALLMAAVTAAVLVTAAVVLAAVQCKLAAHKKHLFWDKAQPPLVHPECEDLTKLKVKVAVEKGAVGPNVPNPERLEGVVRCRRTDLRDS